jgi:hypothetical protein
VLMVIFGAGASYDSDMSHPTKTGDDVLQHRLPLSDHLFDGRELFAQTMERFPECQFIIHKLRHRNDKQTVEQALEILRAESKKHDQAIREMVAIRFYLQRMIWDCQAGWAKVHRNTTNFKTFLYLIRQYNKAKDACFVTFNYDTMLEDALPAVEIKIENINDYVTATNYKIFKVHGSVNWGRVISDRSPISVQGIDGEAVAAAIIQHAPFIITENLVSDDYRIVHNLVLLHKSDNVPLFPALAIPLESKRDFECPAAHLRVLKQCIPKSSKLLIVGWRATDAPFLELLKEAPKEMVVHIICSGSIENKQIADRMETAGIRAQKFFTDYTGFSDFLRSRNPEGVLMS